MKLFAFMLGLYILALSGLPCNDQDDCRYDAQNQTSGSSASHSNHDDTEGCPPFCVCACCGRTFSTDFASCTIPFAAPLGSHDFPVYTPAFTPQVYFNIWQPPKIS